MRMLTPFNTLAPRSLVSQFFEDLDPLFDSFDRDISNSGSAGFMPAMDVTESEDRYVLSLDVPGMKKEDIKIEMSGNLLTLSGERKRENRSDTEGSARRYERSYGYFQRSFTLPDSVDADHVEAVYEDGVLQVVLPKAASAKPRRIEIGAKKGGLMNRILGGQKNEEKNKTIEVEKHKEGAQSAKVS